MLRFLLFCFVLLSSACFARDKLPLERAIETALSANKSLNGGRLIFESEQHALVSAQSEFDVCIMPSVSLRWLGKQTGSCDLASGNAVLDQAIQDALITSVKVYANCRKTPETGTIECPDARVKPIFC